MAGSPYRARAGRQIGAKPEIRCAARTFRYPLPMDKLPRRFYDRDTEQVARELLGQWIVHQTGDRRLIGRIVETEAYLGPHDLAAHSSKGVTSRTRIMFGPPGHAYVYLIYGQHHCMNVVTEREGNGAAVLLRAVEPVENLAGRTCGPGLLCQALAIDRRLNGLDLLGEELFLAPAPDSTPIRVVERARIGVEYAKHWARRKLRFYIQDNPFVSRP